MHIAAGRRPVVFAGSALSAGALSAGAASVPCCTVCGLAIWETPTEVTPTTAAMPTTRLVSIALGFMMLMVLSPFRSKRNHSQTCATHSVFGQRGGVSRQPTVHGVLCYGIENKGCLP